MYPWHDPSDASIKRWFNYGEYFAHFGYSSFSGYLLATKPLFVFLFLFQLHFLETNCFSVHIKGSARHQCVPLSPTKLELIREHLQLIAKLGQIQNGRSFLQNAKLKLWTQRQKNSFVMCQSRTAKSESKVANIETSVLSGECFLLFNTTLYASKLSAPAVHALSWESLLLQ